MLCWGTGHPLCPSHRPHPALSGPLAACLPRCSLGLVGKYGTFVSLLAGKAVFMPVVKGYVRSFLGLGPRYKVVSVAPNGRQLAELAKLAAAGTLKPIVHSVLPLERARWGVEGCSGMWLRM